MSAKATDIDARIRAAAAAELKKQVKAATSDFHARLNSLRAANTYGNQHEISNHVHAGGARVVASVGCLLEALAVVWLADHQGPVEDKAVADFIERVDRLAGEVEEIRYYAQGNQ